jgi:hypothetical protein
MINQINTIINGHTYSVTQYPAIQGWTLLTKIMSIFAVEPSKYIEVLQEIDQNGELLLEVLSLVMRDGQAMNKQTFNKFYTGNLSEALLVVIFVIKYNFSDFLEEGKRTMLIDMFNQLFQSPAEKEKEKEQEQK